MSRDPSIVFAEVVSSFNLSRASAAEAAAMKAELVLLKATRSRLESALLDAYAVNRLEVMDEVLVEMRRNDVRYDRVRARVAGAMLASAVSTIERLVGPVELEIKRAA